MFRVFEMFDSNLHSYIHFTKSWTNCNNWPVCDTITFNTFLNIIYNVHPVTMWNWRTWHDVMTSYHACQEVDKHVKVDGNIRDKHRGHSWYVNLNLKWVLHFSPPIGRRGSKNEIPAQNRIVRYNHGSSITSKYKYSTAIKVGSSPMVCVWRGGAGILYRDLMFV